MVSHHLNPEARSFIPLYKLIHQYYVVSQHTPYSELVFLYYPTLPPFLPSQNASFIVSPQEPNHHSLLHHAESDHHQKSYIEEKELEEEGIRRRRSVELGRWRGKLFRPPQWVRRKEVHGGDGGGGHDDEKIIIEAGGGSNSNNSCELGEFKGFVGKKKGFQFHHPVVPVRADGNDTTVMIRNIPNKYNRAMLVEFLDKHCLMENEKLVKQLESNIVGGEEYSAYDLVYLPIDFKSGLNKGYAFVNFTNAKGARKFHSANNDQKWDFFQSHKICHVALARLQGKEKLERHLESMSFPREWEEVLPVCFSPPRKGTNKPLQRTLGKLVN